MLKSVFTVICSAGIQLACHAQLQVKGIILDNDGKPIPYASIMLLVKVDSSLVAGQISNINGLFTVDVKHEGDYYIAATAVGYRKVFSPLFHLTGRNSPMDIDALITHEKIEQLNEVTIEGEKPMFEQKIDRTVINVQNNISKAGGSALDVLQRSPGVTVDKMKNAIALSGKQGVRIMINGKISRIPNDAVVQMLSGMNAENIERIELITTPSSKYEAEGDAGMINIVLKKSEDIGSNGDVSVFTGYGRRGKLGGTLNVNRRSKKLNLFADFSVRKNYTREYWNSQWTTPINNELTTTASNNNRKAFTGITTGGAGFEWNISKRTTIGGLFNFFDRQWDMDALADVTRDINGDLYSQTQMSTLEKNDWLQLLGNINASHVFNENYTLSFDLDNIDYNSLNPTDYSQLIFDNIGSYMGTVELRSRKNTNIKIWTSSIDIEGKINDKILFEAGAKGTFSTLSNDIKVDNLENLIWVPDNDYTSYADMHENIGAGHASVTIKASSKLDLQMGIRYEHTRTDLDTRTEQNVVDRNFGKWFPSFFLNKKIDDNNSWVASYSRRISRPSFLQLAPFVIFNDPNSFYSGNERLLPSFTDSYKLEYRHKSILISLQHSHDKNSITFFQPQINENNKQVTTTQNLSYRNNYSLVFSFPIEVTKWWEMHWNAIGNMTDIKADYLSEAIFLSNANFSLTGSQKFKVTQTITAEISGYYQSNQYFGVWEVKHMGALDLGLEKKFSHSTLRISYSDIFGTNKWNSLADIPVEQLISKDFYNEETTILNITYSLQFGNLILKARGQNKTGSKEEQDRLK